MNKIDIYKIAHLIEPAKDTNFLVNKKYNTQSIIDVILKENERAHLDVLKLADAIKLKNPSLYEVSYALWYFIKKHIIYKEDGMKYQAIKSPSRLWKDKSGDCKSMTLFSCAVLKALGYDYSIRFVSYNLPKIYTHVYCIAHGPASDYIIDPVWKGDFNTQKNFNFKKDYKMEGLYSMGSIRNLRQKAAAKRRRLQNMSPAQKAKLRAMRKKRRKGILSIPSNFSEAGLDAAIIRQRLEIERNILDCMGRIGKVDEFDESLDVLDEFIGALENDDYDTMDAVISGLDDDLEDDFDDDDFEIEGIGGRKKRKARRAARKAKRKTRRKKRVQKGKKFLKKIAKKAKKGLKAVAKVVTAPQRLLAKGILEVGLPTAAPMFLYLFIKPSQLSVVPSTVVAKRKKQEKVANFIVNGIGMKRNHFMGILRNGIMKKYKKSPEKVLVGMFDGINGIGFVAAVAALVPKVIEIITKIIQKFGKKDGGNLIADVKSMVVDATDFASMNSAKKVAVKKDLLRKDAAQTAPGSTIEALSNDSINYDFDENDNEIIPADGGSTGPKGICG